jgi:hypothetical protein
MASVSTSVRPVENACWKRNRHLRFSFSQQEALSSLGQRMVTARPRRPRKTLTVCERIVALQFQSTGNIEASQVRISYVSRDFVVVDGRVACV